MKTIPVSSSNFTFQEFTREDRPAKETAKKSKGNKAPLELLLRLVESANANLDIIQKAAGLGSIDKKIEKGHALPVPLFRSVRSFLETIVNTETVLHSCYARIDADKPDIGRRLAAAAEDSRRLLSSIEEINTFRSTSHVIQEKRKQRVNDAILRITKHLALVKAFLKEELAVIKMEDNVQSSSKVEELKKNVKTQNMEPILEAFKEKGWKVPENQNVENGIADVDTGLQLSNMLLKSIQKPSTELLPDNCLIGVIRFPSILRLMKRPRDLVIQKCLEPTTGYNLYMVFGSYLVVDHAIAIGINRKLMRIYGEKGKVEIDVEKFDKLLPYVMNEFPDWRDSLSSLLPTLPIHASGKHYYSLMLPKSVVSANEIRIGDWQFVRQRTH